MGIAVLVSLLGFGLVIFGGLLFMPDAPQVPLITGDWPKLIVTFLGAGWSLLGTVQFFRHGRGFLGKAFLSLLCFLSVAGAGGNAFWVLKLSYDVPAPVTLTETVPAFELQDQRGETVSDVSLRGKPYVLIFARGVW
jgi:hypothetical protein